MGISELISFGNPEQQFDEVCSIYKTSNGASYSHGVNLGLFGQILAGLSDVIGQNDHGSVLSFTTFGSVWFEADELELLS